MTLDYTDGTVVIEEAVVQRSELFSAVGIEKHTGRESLVAGQYFNVVHGRSAAKVHSVFSIRRR
jgi:repressor of nif and glnA expression